MPCTICFDSLTAANVFELECGHVFHTHCLVKLIKSRNRKCPLCRHRIRLNIKQVEAEFLSYKCAAEKA